MLTEPTRCASVDPDTDADMISRWMNMPHLVEAWESAWPVSRWRDYLRAQLDGNYSRPFVGSMHGEDGGYVEVYRAAKDSIATRYHADPYDVGLHAAIAELTVVNKGLGPFLLPRIVASVFEVEPRCRRIMFDPDHRNTRGAAAVRIRRLHIPRRARHEQSPDGAVRVAPHPGRRAGCDAVLGGPPISSV